MRQMDVAVAFRCMAYALAHIARRAAKRELRESDAEREYDLIRAEKAYLTGYSRPVRNKGPHVSEFCQAIKFGIVFGHEGVDMLEFVLSGKYKLKRSRDAIVAVCRWSLKEGRLPDLNELENDVIRIYVEW